MISRRALHLLITLGASVSAAACAQPSDAPLPPLPDVTVMAAPVQEQMREQYQRLTVRSPAFGARERAAELGRMGQLLMAAEAVQAAEPFLTQAAALDPAEPRWAYYLGHLARMQGNPAGAARAFERVLTLRPDDVPSLVWLGHVALDQGQADVATASYERALTLQPGLFAAQFGLGRAALVAGDHQRAVARLEALLAADARATAVNYPLALAYRSVGRLEEAETRLRARGDTQPPLPDPLLQELVEILRSPVVYETRGDRALAAGQPARAVEAFRQAVTLAPDRRALKHKLATALALTGDVPAAVTFYQELLAQDPNFAEAHYSLGALFLGSGQIPQAIERFAAAVKADPTYVAAHLQLAHTLRRARAYDRALAAYQAALAAEPRLAEARLGYAVTLADAGRYATARAWLNQARRAHPTHLEFVELLVRVLAAAPDAGVRDGPTAIELGEGLVRQSRSWRTVEALAMALAESGRWDDAVARQRDAMALGRGDRRAEAAAPALADNLRRYERHQPSRMPWTGDPL